MPFENIVPVVVIGLGFPLFFVGLFVLVIVGTASRSGWTLLAKYYAFRQPFTGKKWHMQSARMGFSHYRGCLTVGASNEGLYLATSFPFSFGHSPLFIPWSDITIAEQQERHGLYVDLTFPKAPQVRLRFPHRFGTTVVATHSESVSVDRDSSNL